MEEELLKNERFDFFEFNKMLNYPMNDHDRSKPSSLPLHVTHTFCE